MSLSRKHYEAIAAVVAEQAAEYAGSVEDFSAGGAWAVEQTAKNLATYFAADNPNFDRQRFLAACQVEA